jgi:hypothetical protein
MRLGDTQKCACDPCASSVSAQAGGGQFRGGQTPTGVDSAQAREVANPVPIEGQFTVEEVTAGSAFAAATSQLRVSH